MRFFRVLEPQKRASEPSIAYAHDEASQTTSFKTCLRLGGMMRVSDPRWPAVRELARTLLRTQSLRVVGPSWLEQELQPLTLKLSDVQPARTEFPSFGVGDAEAIQFTDPDNNVIMAQCSQHEPASNVVWLPMGVVDGWTALSEVATDLLNAGYPGCLGCGGPHSEGEWEEHESRQRMKFSSTGTP